MTEFQAFPKIGRLSRDVIVTEKIDGTNAQIFIDRVPVPTGDVGYCAIMDGFVLRAGSRNGFVTPGKSTDNFGFAAWVADNAPELVKLGEGRHFGEWWGQGIQRNYGLTEKRFSLFNVSRWSDDATRPACCHVVPTLWRGNFDTASIQNVLAQLLQDGSLAAPGFMKPEGVVIFHTQSGALFKKTYDKDDAGKGREPEVRMSA